MKFFSQCTLIGALFLGLMSEGQAQQETPLHLQVKMNNEVVQIIESLLNSFLVNSSFETSDRKVQLMPTSDLSNGRIETKLVSKETTDEFGTINIQLNSASEQLAALSLESELVFKKDVFFKNLQTVTDAIFSKLKIPSQSSFNDLASFKDQIINALASASPKSERKKQSFGGGSSQSSSDSGVNENAFLSLQQALSESMTVENSQEGQTLSIDFNSLRQKISQNAAVDAVKSELSSFEIVKITLSNETVHLHTSTSLSLPLKSIQVYDDYLHQTQDGDPSKLQMLSQLVTDFGPWVVGRCSQENYKATCAEKILVSCAKSTDTVEKCVSIAQSLQDARAAKSDGDYLKATTSTLGAATKELGSTVTNWLNGN